MIQAVLHPGLQYLERYLDRIGMYRVVSGGLGVLALCALLAGALDLLAYTFIEQATSLVLVLVTALSLNWLIARICKLTANHESAIITALIVHFLILPAGLGFDQHVLVLATAAAIISKYVIAYRRQHLINPAAAGALALSLPGYFEATWWVSSPVLFIPLLITGLAVVMKIRKWTPVLWFIGVSFLVYSFESWRLGFDLMAASETFVLSWPVLFLAFFMLTEPFTMPPTKRLQAAYGALAGFLANTTLFMPVLAMSPELALVVANLVFYRATLRQKLYLELITVRELAKHTFEFVFKKPSGMTFLPGQYLEWMLPHEAADSRGLRRYFTIASAPEEPELRLGVKFGDSVSSYKQQLQSLQPGDQIIASQLAGDFLLPKDPSIKMAWVAGGIGVTPFRSFAGHMKATGEVRDVTLFYCNNTEAEIAYRTEFTEATGQGLQTIHVLAKEERSGYEHGYLSTEIIARQLPDYAERTWYLSGPSGMVTAYQQLLLEMGVPRRQIVTDFFPGLA